MAKLFGRILATDDKSLLDLVDRYEQRTSEHPSPESSTSSEEVAAIGPLTQACFSAMRELEDRGVPSGMLLVVGGFVRAEALEPYLGRSSWHQIEAIANVAHP